MLENIKESSTGVTQEKPRSFSQRLFSGVGEVAIILADAFLVSTVLRNSAAQMFNISNGSMENILKMGDRVLMVKLGGFRRGDIMVFEDPARWLSGSQPKHTQMKQVLEFIGVLLNSGAGYLIKCVIGMPGNRVACCIAEEAVTVSGGTLDEPQYLYSENGVQAAPSTMSFNVIIPIDHISALGDHRDASVDFRCYLRDVRDDKKAESAAFVPKNKVAGAAVAVVAPLDRLSTFRVLKTLMKIPKPERKVPAEPTIIGTPTGC